MGKEHLIAGCRQTDEMCVAVRASHCSVFLDNRGLLIWLRYHVHENDLSILVEVADITSHITISSLALHFGLQWSARDLEMSLVWNSKIVLVLNLVLVVQSKRPLWLLAIYVYHRHASHAGGVAILLSLSMLNETRVQAPVVRKVDNAIHRINHYPADSRVCFVNIYPLDSVLSSGIALSSLWTTGARLKMMGLD